MRAFVFAYTLHGDISVFKGVRVSMHVPRNVSGENGVENLKSVAWLTMFERGVSTRIETLLKYIEERCVSLFDNTPTRKFVLIFFN